MVKVNSEKPVVSRKVVCTRCGYEWEYSGEDVYEGRSTDYTGSSDLYYYIVCPRLSCGNNTKVACWRNP